MTTPFQNHRLQVRVGTSIDNLKKIVVNDDANPFELNSDTFKGRGVVRVRNFTGVNKAAASSSPYFENYPDKFSIQMQGRFLVDTNADQIIFGNFFDAPLRLPTGTSIATKFAKWFDPAIELDLYADKPTAYSPLVVTMNSIDVKKVSDDLPSWPSPNGERIQEDAQLLKVTNGDRRKLLSTKTERNEIKISSDMVFSMDFYNPYLDFDKCAIQIPGFEISVLKYWDGQPLRYVAKMRDNSAVFFIIEFLLVEALEGDKDEKNEGENEDESIDNDID